MMRADRRLAAARDAATEELGLSRLALVAGCAAAAIMSAAPAAHAQVRLPGFDDKRALCVAGGELSTGDDEDCDDFVATGQFDGLGIGPAGQDVYFDANTGTAVFNNTATFNGSATFNGATSIANLNSGNLSNSGSLTTGSLTTSGNANFNGAITARGIQALSVNAVSATLGSTNLFDSVNVLANTTITMSDNRIRNVGGPVDASDAATKGYVDASLSGVQGGINSLTNQVTNQGNRLTAVENVNTQQNGRINAVEAKNGEQDDRLTATETVNTQQNGRLTAVETVNTRQDAQLAAIGAQSVVQDGRITAVETINTRQDTQLTSIETRNTTQDTRITATETVNSQQTEHLNRIDALDITQDDRLTSAETVNTQQSTRLTSVETVNTQQNTRLSSIESVNQQHDTRLAGIDGLNTRQDARLTAGEALNAVQDNRLAASEAINAQQSTAIGELQDRTRTLQSDVVGLRKDIRRANGGIAAAVALGGVMMVPDSRATVSFNLATYRGEQAFSGAIVGEIAPKVYVQAGVAGSTVKGSTTGRVGIAFGL